ncbi:PQQ-dependent sugar dehydrogenase [Sorangium sp. So ce131]|uniref:PQQ-dependent sugar dehydrogenase n=1 Tax=Sorangium sp. So ce131 TaxID=3133282 RepID=UPI003F5F30D7
MMDQKRSFFSFVPLAAALFGLGFILNACGSDTDGGGGGSGGGGSGAGTPTGTTTGTGVAPGTGAGTPTGPGTGGGDGTSTSGTSGSGAGPTTGTGAGGHGSIDCDDPAGTVPALKLTEVVSGLNRPLYVTSEPADASRLYVVEQGGTIRIVSGGALQSGAFLDITSIVQQSEYAGDERGLLGLAFHPDYASNGRFFIFHNTRARSTVLKEYRRSSDNPDLADPTPVREFFTVTGLRGNHNGGMLAFGPDGMLYVGVGDGGSDGDAQDPDSNGQNIETKKGKILRIDVDNYPTPPAGNLTGGDPDIWDYGLRNPWRFSFDQCSGDLYIGDVGAKDIEEINIEPRGQGNRNYGWSIFEGSNCFQPTQEPGCDLPNHTLPVKELSHGTGDGGSITGGYVYRGSNIPGLRGTYLYGDFSNNRIYSLVWKNGALVSSGNMSANLGSEDTLQALASFGEDAAGELYVVDYAVRNANGTVSGRLYRIDPE